MVDIERFKEEISNYIDESGYVVIPALLLLTTLYEVNKNEPVKHGHWIRPYNDHYKQCSVCKRIHYAIPWNAEYCPFCGAKMEGDKK